MEKLESQGPCKGSRLLSVPYQGQLARDRLDECELAHEGALEKRGSRLQLGLN